MRCTRYLTIAPLLVFHGCQRVHPDLIIDVDAKVNPWTDLDFQVNNDGNPDHFQFAVWGDPHYALGSSYSVAGVQACAAAMERYKPEFVITVGDNIEGNFQDGNFHTLWPDRDVPWLTGNWCTETEAKQLLNSEWDDLDALTKPMASPMFYCAGNHELTTQGQYIGYERDDTRDDNGKDFSVEVWEERYGRQYYHFVYRNVLFLIANTEDPPHDHMSAAQNAYFDKVLATYGPGDVRWTFLIQHQPPKNSGLGEIEDKLSGRNHTTFHGHDHSWRPGGTVYAIPPTYQGKVVWVTMTDEGPVIRLVTDLDSLEEAVAAEE